jgi:hypothetical protein
MKNWNYRVVRKQEKNGTTSFAIHEVYYDKNGKPFLCSALPERIVNDDLNELKTNILRFLKAFSKPILNYEDF